jgi:hypothetical protein
MKIMHESLKSFLAAKGFITAAQAELPGFPPVVELAYKSYAEHKCGIQPPQDIPINLEQVPVRILDDADWRWLDVMEEESTEEADLDDEDEDDGNMELNGEGKEPVVDVPAVPESTVLPVAEPVTAPTLETGDAMPSTTEPAAQTAQTEEEKDEAFFAAMEAQEAEAKKATEQAAENKGMNGGKDGFGHEDGDMSDDESDDIDKE